MVQNPLPHSNTVSQIFPWESCLTVSPCAPGQETSTQLHHWPQWFFAEICDPVRISEMIGGTSGKEEHVLCPYDYRKMRIWRHQGMPWEAWKWNQHLRRQNWEMKRNWTLMPSSKPLDQTIPEVKPTSGLFSYEVCKFLFWLNLVRLGFSVTYN